MRKIESLVAIATTVAEEFDTAKAATDARVESEAALLAALVERIKPALRALSSRLVKRRCDFWPDSVSTATEKTYHDERGFHVAGDDGAGRDHPNANRGNYEGRGLWLLEDGTFATREFRGDWSKWQGETSEWQSVLTTVFLLENVARAWSIDEIIVAISAALDAQIGTRAKATKAAIERAETLRAVTALVAK